MFPSSKEVFLHNFRQFFDGNSTGADLTKIVKFCTGLNCTKEIFLAKLYVPLIKRSVSPQF